MLIKKLGIIKDTNGKKTFSPIAIDELDTNNTATIRTFDTDTMTAEDLPVIKGDDGQLHRYTIVSVSNNAFAKVREIKYTGYPDSNVTTMTLLERLTVLRLVFADIENGVEYLDRKAYGIERNKSIGYVCVDKESIDSAISLHKEMLALDLKPLRDLIRDYEPIRELAQHYITSKKDDTKLWLYKFDALDIFEHFKPAAYADKVETIGEIVSLD